MEAGQDQEIHPGFHRSYSVPMQWQYLYPAESCLLQLRVMHCAVEPQNFYTQRFAFSTPVVAVLLHPKEGHLPGKVLLGSAEVQPRLPTVLYYSPVDNSK